MQDKSPKHFDLIEESSKRKEGEEATVAARQVESDYANEETNAGPVNSPDDKNVENEVWTSLSDE